MVSCVCFLSSVMDLEKFVILHLLFLAGVEALGVHTPPRWTLLRIKDLEEGA